MQTPNYSVVGPSGLVRSFFRLETANLVAKSVGGEVHIERCDRCGERLEGETAELINSSGLRIFAHVECLVESDELA